jgi:hypoxia up-regulated 1
MLKNAESMKQLIKNQIENDEQTYSSSLSASSATSTESESSSSTPTPAASDEGLDDLDEDVHSTSTTSTKTAVLPKPTGPKYSLFTPADLTTITQAYESTAPWLETQLSLQDKLTESDDPALTLVEVDSRLRDFERILNRLYERMTAAAGQQKKSSGNKGKKGKSDSEKKAKAKEQPKKEKEDLRKDEL